MFSDLKFDEILNGIRHSLSDMHAHTVLVVEDSPLNARLFRTLLSRAGLLVTVAVDAETALDTLDRLTPDVILMDMQLPGMSGDELTRRLKADPARRGILIIAVTANNSSADRQIMIESGCDGFISKPIVPADFVAAVMTFIPEGEPALPASVSKGECAEEEQFLRLKRKFLSEGVVESQDLLGGDAKLVGCILHRWIGCGGSAGILEISERAQTIRDLICRRAADLTALTVEAEAVKRLFSDALAACPS